jgi:hypothetical protein
MGGFLLEAKQGDTAMTFPIDAEQLYYLVDKGHLDYPTITKEEINDKNKADGLAR